jgi:two-component system chemotaxis response regulator CheY
MKVLVVDDEAAIRELLELILVTEGHAVALARDGAEALASVDAVAPDIILLDLKMPVMDGREFAERYRAREGKTAPIVVISAVQKLSEYADLGACAVLAKPFELQVLLDAIARCTGQKAEALPAR